MSGWLKLHRSLIDNPLWTAEPFSKGQAWVHLLMTANHKDGGFYKNGQWVPVKRGQTGESVLSLAKRFRWSKNKLVRCLKQLEANHMIELKTNHLTTIITICNYNDYQGGEPTDGPPNEPTGEPSDGTPNGSQTRMKRSKEVKNKRKTPVRFSAPTLEMVTEFMNEFASAGHYAADFHDFYESKDWKVGSAKMKDWKAAARRWVRNNNERQQKSAPGNDAAEAWDKLIALIKRHGSNGEWINKLPEHIRKCTRECGGIREIGMANEFNLRQKRSQFVAAYKDYKP